MVRDCASYSVPSRLLAMLRRLVKHISPSCFSWQDIEMIALQVREENANNQEIADAFRKFGRTIAAMEIQRVYRGHHGRMLFK